MGGKNKGARKRSRRRRLESTLAYIAWRWGPEAVRQGAPARAPGTVPHVPTGFVELDAVLGIGGIPRGQLTVLSGVPTSGKRTLAALILANAQTATRQPVAYIDVGHTCNPDYLLRCGVQLDELLVGRPADIRQALDMLLIMAERRELAAVVFDVWAALDGDASDGATRRYAVAALEQLGGRLARSRAALVVLDEPPALWRGLARGLLAAAWGATGGADEGHDIRFSLRQRAAVQLALRRERWLTHGPDVRGYQVQVAVEKNKHGPAGRSVMLEIRFNGVVRGDGL